ncbi:MAG: MlaD family protein [Candidatus Omnitrophota bacterium]
MAVDPNLELKVGTFVVIAIILLTIFIFLVSDISLFTPGWQMKIIFGFADGVKVAAPVRVAGVDMGKVKEIKMFYDAQKEKTIVEVKVWLRREARVPVDSKAWVNQLGLLGEKYVEIIPGKNYAAYLKDGDVLLGDDSISMRELGEMGKRIAERLDNSLSGVDVIFNQIKKGEGTIGRLLFDETLYKDLEALAADLKANPWKLLRK